MPKRIFTAALALILLALCFSLPVRLSAEDINQSVIRLHIKANSDNPFDQQIKLEVRDRLIEAYKESLKLIGSVEEAEEYITQNRDEIILLVNEVLRKNAVFPKEITECLFSVKAST